MYPETRLKRYVASVDKYLFNKDGSINNEGFIRIVQRGRDNIVWIECPTDYTFLRMIRVPFQGGPAEVEQNRVGDDESCGNDKQVVDVERYQLDLGRDIDASKRQ